GPASVRYSAGHQERSARPRPPDTEEPLRLNEAGLCCDAFRLPSQKTLHLPANRARFRNLCSDLGSTTEIPAAYELVFRQTRPAETGGTDQSAFTNLNTPAAADAVPVGESQTLLAPEFFFARPMTAVEFRSSRKPPGA